MISTICKVQCIHQVQIYREHILIEIIKRINLIVLTKLMGRTNNFEALYYKFIPNWTNSTFSQNICSQSDLFCSQSICFKEWQVMT